MGKESVGKSDVDIEALKAEISEIKGIDEEKHKSEIIKII